MKRNDTVRLVQEPDRLNKTTVIVIGVVSVLITIASILISSAILIRRENALHPGIRQKAPASAAPRTIGMLEQTLIREDRFGVRLADEQRAELGRYGWVDRDQGLVSIPIERAFELMLGGDSP
jgi:hypothetical protein